jgi:hypothetical protein
MAPIILQIANAAHLVDPFELAMRIEDNNLRLRDAERRDAQRTTDGAATNDDEEGSLFRQSAVNW